MHRQGVRCAEFKPSITSFVAGFFVDPIHVVYDLERKRLIEYRGLSNIPDEKGKCHEARIVFMYPTGTRTDGLHTKEERATALASN